MSTKHDDDPTPATFGALGGAIRAQRLSGDQRAAIARHAAEARWSSEGKLKVARATHSGTLMIGGMAIPCAVLDDGRRVLSENGITNALLGSRSGASKRLKRDGAPLPLFLAPSMLKPFIHKELMDGPLAPIAYRQGDGVVVGYSADILPAVCDVWLKAREARALQTQQQDKAKKAEILMRGLAHVGITALVDEATGYQDVRARDALAKILEAFVAKELQKWVSTFPPEFYKELFRLRGIPYTETLRRPKYVGHLTNNLVYKRLAPGVLAELRLKNPVADNGRRKTSHHQWLTQQVGHPRLLQHLGAVTALMKVSDNWESFKTLLNRALPLHAPLPLFDEPARSRLA